MKIKNYSRAKGKVFLLALAFLLVLTACGKSVNELEAAGDIQGLMNVLSDKNEKGSIRKDAALALGQIGDPAAVEPLIRYLQECSNTLGAHSSNDEWQACFDAVGPMSESLGHMGDTRAVEPLIEMLEELWVHEEAVQALGMLNDARAILPLIDTLDHGTSQFTDMGERWILHYDAIHNLAVIASPETFDALRDALPGFRTQEVEGFDKYHLGCHKYRLALDALITSQDPRLEALLLSLLKTYDDCNGDIGNALAELWDYDQSKLLQFMKLGNGYSYQSNFAAIYFSQTPKPKPIEVDFGSIYEYPNETEVSITGQLWTPGIAFTCEPDYLHYPTTGQLYCNVNLANPSSDKDRIVIYLQETNQVKMMPNPYTEKDLQVRIDNGEWTGHGTLVRITGTIYSLQGGALYNITSIEPVE